MKKWIIVIIACISVLISTGCKKKNDLGEIDHHIIGVYFEMEEDQTYQLGGVNPSVYYHHASKTLKTNSGLYNVRYDSISKNNFTDDDGIKTCIVNIMAIFHEDLPDEIKVYIVFEGINGSCYVDTTGYEVINLGKGGNYKLDYTYKINKQVYRIQFKLGYSKRSA